MGIIPEKVWRIRALTTFTLRDLPCDTVSDWSVEGSIYGQVEREDLLRWSQQAPPLDRIVPPIPHAGRPNRLSLFVFVRGILP